MVNYVRQQSAGDVFRNAATIYKNNFLPLLLVYVLPVFPFIAVQQYAVGTGKEGLVSLLTLLTMVVSFPLLLPFTVAISEICLGNKASIVHSFRRILEKGVSGFIQTFLLYSLVVFVGMLLIIIPGIIFTMWYMFTLQITVIEGTFGRKALKRSKELGKGFYWRNFGIYSLLYIVMIAVAMTFGGLLGFFLGLLLPGVPNHVAGILGAAIGQLLSPVPYIGGVLLYYDMRSRKEAYDTTALAEDLMR